jgi:hypothetical protein
MLSTWLMTAFEMRLRNAERVATLGASLQKIVTEGGLPQGEGPQRWLRGWAQAHLSSPHDGHRLILEGYERNARLGMFAGCTEVL